MAWAGVIMLVLALAALFLWNSRRKPTRPQQILGASSTNQQFASESNESIRPIVDRLKGKDREAAKEAILEVTKIGKPAVSALIALLQDNDPLTRANAAFTLGQVGLVHSLDPKNLFPTLTNHWRDPDANVRYNVLVAVRCIRPDASVAIPFLTRALTDPETKIRKLAMASLSFPYGSEAKSAIPDVVRSLKDPDADVRALAASNLAKLGPAAQEAIPALKAAVGDRDKNVREEAARALRQITSGNILDAGSGKPIDAGSGKPIDAGSGKPIDAGSGKPVGAR